MVGNPGTWTTITGDMQLVRHLLELYFCWEYPTLASLSREHFLQDFEDGRRRYCSSLLVNALLALGSRFCNRPEIRGDPNDPFTTGDEFFREALRLFWEVDDFNDLTVIQALGIMAIREASCGRDFESRYYAGQSMRLAIEIGLHRQETYETEDKDLERVRLKTFWGAFALDNVWSITTGSLPHFSRFPKLPPKVSPIPELEHKLWIPYTDDGLALEHPCEQPIHITSVYNCLCDLSEIIHTSLYRIHCAARRPTSADILSIYTRYLRFYENMPSQLRLGANFTPQVMFVHLYYHFAIVVTFRPFIKYRLRNSELVPRTLCLQAADAIQTHIRAYSRLYSLRRTPSFVPYIFLVCSRVYIACATSLPPSQQPPPASETRAINDALKRNISALDDMASCHRAALIGANMLQYMAKALNVFLDIRDHDPMAQIQNTGGVPDLFARGEKKGGEEGERQGPLSQGGTDTSGAAPGYSSTLEDEEPLQRALTWPAPKETPMMVPREGTEEEMGFEEW